MPYKNPENHKEKTKAYRREYREKNKEKIKKVQKAWVLKNKKQIAEYRERTKGHKKEYMKEWLKKKKECPIWREKKKEYKQAYDQTEKRKKRIAEYSLENKEKIYKRALAWRVKNRPRLRVKNNIRAEKRRTVLVNLMGGICKCCGENDPIYLQFDHVNNDGNLEKKSERGHRSWKLSLKAYQANPNRYQLLCANCNWAKQLNGGELYKPKKKRKAA